MSLTIRNMIDFAEPVIDLYHKGLGRGSSTGWQSLDEYYTVQTGQWTVITGAPGSGKSEWLDALMTNLMRDSGWQHVIFSPENQPHELHIAKLLEKWLHAPFADGPSIRMTQEQMAKAMVDIDAEGRLAFLTVDAEFAGLPSVSEILDAAAVQIDNWRKRGTGQKVSLVIDPWNECDHARPDGRTETEYISRTLSVIRQFGRDWDIHVFVVAHPTKLAKDKDGKRPIPTPWDIAGSAHWYNKADACLTVYRDPLLDGIVEVHVQKVRFKNIGKVGVVGLHYDRITGTYRDAMMPSPVRKVAVNPGREPCPI